MYRNPKEQVSRNGGHQTNVGISTFFGAVERQNLERYYKNNVLIIGNGGREHAIGWKLQQSPKVGKIYFAPGNAGTAQVGENINLDISDHKEVIKNAKKHKISLVVVAPDNPLAAGMVDDLTAVGIRAFGPIRQAAQIESSKAFAKELMKAAHIPTASFKTFTDYRSAHNYLINQQVPIVIKASGLALGKGVVVAQTIDDAETALKEIMVDKIHGEAGSTVIIEEYLQGVEVSFHAFCDGTTAKLFPTSQDHKQIFDGDIGPNTGGMGTIAPVPWVTKDVIDEVKNTIILPILNELTKRGIEYKGILYPGIMITKNGPKVLEFNARFGDPETQSYMRLLKTDLYNIFNACINSTLHDVPIEWNNNAACCIVIASKGYPESSQKGMVINGISGAEKEKDIVIFHAATKKKNNELVTNGGRVLGVTAIGRNLDKALQKAYKGVRHIHFEGMQYRKDIGKRNSPKFIKTS